MECLYEGDLAYFLLSFSLTIMTQDMFEISEIAGQRSVPRYYFVASWIYVWLDGCDSMSMCQLQSIRGCNYNTQRRL